MTTFILEQLIILFMDYAFHIGSLAITKCKYLNIQTRHIQCTFIVCSGRIVTHQRHSYIFSLLSLHVMIFKYVYVNVLHFSFAVQSSQQLIYVHAQISSACSCEVKMLRNIRRKHTHEQNNFPLTQSYSRQNTTSIDFCCF